MQTEDEDAFLETQEAYYASSRPSAASNEAQRQTFAQQAREWFVESACAMWRLLCLSMRRNYGFST